MLHHRNGDESNKVPRVTSIKSSLMHEDAVTTGLWHLSIMHLDGMLNEDDEVQEDEEEGHSFWVHMLH